MSAHHDPGTRRCAQCGREGTRAFVYTIAGVYVCANKRACKHRQNLPIWRVKREPRSTL